MPTKIINLASMASIFVLDGILHLPIIISFSNIQGYSCVNYNNLPGVDGQYFCVSWYPPPPRMSISSPWCLVPALSTFRIPYSADLQYM